MSWRKFQILIGGFSTNSNLANIIHNEKQVIKDPAEAEKAVDNVWS